MPVGVVVEHQRLAGLDHRRVHREQSRPGVPWQQIEQPRSDQLFTRHPVVLARSVVGVDIDEVDDLVVLVTDRIQEHVGIEQRIDHRPQLQVAGIQPLLGDL
ncbi:unannotated protein [freshwater metagenome]|uniref:Unannotated protein n=1 Tax=freshwater metagenome TaxID=449393 RepID=A0A6J7BY33_9ZZZZ